MDNTLKKRLLSGTIMAALFTAIIAFDAWLDGSISAAMPNKNIQATLFCFLVALMAIPAQLEIARLAKSGNLEIFLPPAIIASIALATTPYWPQLFQIPACLYLMLILAATVWVLFIWQFVKFRTTNVIANCGANLFAILYLGIMSSFVVAIRIEFGFYHLLMFVFVVKSCDIGAYGVGRLVGKHKFAPAISPKKTWEGMAGGVCASMIVSGLFAAFCDIIDMSLAIALVFGFVFAFIGQLSDLAESMIKRDVQAKDSADKVPGFGGILDVIDSPLMSAAFAYVFFAAVLW